MSNLYHKRNDRIVNFKYPARGTSNVLRSVSGRKIASFTGPNGRGITVKQNDGEVRSFSVKKCVQM
jgi:hypothetical protein